ncbi:MAG TPA: 2-amino-4-hydroxy-6-hydroxymethyldihydropteridine diphosphokinase [Candidatus Binataceae bacterium]|nr:2-amino-4-hydroxy-6-hydroxymethyldihydropteridine diphosphokinase [Candidatus Binataceae bacterium]
MPHRAFIGIGTNLGDRVANFRDAIHRIGALPSTRVVRQSSVYETEPMGDIQGLFLNGVVEVDTAMLADALLRRLLTIERTMGRKRVPANKRTIRTSPQPRVIDLDLLFFENQVADTPALQLPHPRLHERRFVLAPMAELAPMLIHPTLKKSISELLAGLKSPYRVALARADMLRPNPARREVLSR